VKDSRYSVSPFFVPKTVAVAKEMVDRVYGHYREGLEEDSISILEYFGPDFVEDERKLATRLLTLHCESPAKVGNPAGLSA
jgi:hypothetical protein